MNRSRSRTDFGKGFYTTESQKQAESWSKIVLRRKPDGKPTITEYEYENDGTLNVLIFDGPTEEWFDFINHCRANDVTHSYDVVMGPVADDNVFETLSLFTSGILTRDEAIRRLKTARLDGQVSFHTEKALKCLTYLRDWEV